MRRTLARTRDTLTWRTLANHAEVARLKRSAQETELDYRTKSTTEAEDRVAVTRYFALEAFVLLVVAVCAQAMRQTNPWFATLFLLPLSVLFLLIAFFRWLYPLPSVSTMIGLSVAFVVSLVIFIVFVVTGPNLFLDVMAMAGYRNLAMYGVLSLATFPLIGQVLTGTLSEAKSWAVRAFWGWFVCVLPMAMPDARFAYVVMFGLAVFAACVVAHLVTGQYVAFLSANERLPRATVDAYRGHWHRLPVFFHSPGPAALRTYTWSFVILAVLFAVGWKLTVQAERTMALECAGLVGLIAFVVLLAAAWPLLNGWRGIRRSAQALVTFLTYDLNETTAAGVFRFPTPWLRPVWNRCRVLSLVFFLTLTGVLCVAQVPEAYVEPEVPDFNAQETRTPVEEYYVQQLPDSDRRDYEIAVDSSHQKRAAIARERWVRAEYDKEIRSDLLRRVVPITAVVLSAVLPIGLFLLVFTFVSGRLLSAYYDALEAPDATALPRLPTEKELRLAEARPVSPWDNRIERMMESTNPDEREHFYLGRSLFGDYPVLLHEKLLERHAHILGSSGSNKTSIGLAPLLSQIIAREDSSVLILDLKGDMSFFECARREALWAGVPFKWFTNLTGRSSYLFNPLDQSHLPLLTANQQTQIALQALSLEYGEDYGRGYYSALMETVLAAYLRNFPDVHSFRQLASYMSDKRTTKAAGLKEEDLLEAKALEVTVQRLAQLNALNLEEEDLRETPEVYQHRINLPDLLARPQVVYFYLSAPQEPKTVSMVGKLALFSLLSAAAQSPEGARRQTYIIADEFQRLLSQSLEIFFEQARSMKLSFILANQDLSQLKNKGVDILSLVESCTAFKQIFSAQDIESMQRLEQLSGEAQYHAASWSELIDRRINERADGVFGIEHAPSASYDQMARVGVRETEGPRLERNTIIEVSADQFGSFVRFSQNSGFTRYSGYITPVVCEYHVAEEEYRARATAPWPERDGETMVVTADDAKTPESPFVRDPEPSGPAGQDMDDAIDARIDQA